MFISCYHLKKCECKSWYFRFVTLSFPSSTRRLLHTPAKTQTWLLLEIQRLCPTDMEFVKNFTPPDFQAKNFTPSISTNFNSFSGEKTQKMSENGETYTAGKNFTMQPAVTALTNSTSGT